MEQVRLIVVRLLNEICGDKDTQKKSIYIIYLLNGRKIETQGEIKIDKVRVSFSVENGGCSAGLSFWWENQKFSTKGGTDNAAWGVNRKRHYELLKKKVCKETFLLKTILNLFL